MLRIDETDFAYVCGYHLIGTIEKLLREGAGDDVMISKETIDWVNECASSRRHSTSYAHYYSITD